MPGGEASRAGASAAGEEGWLCAWPLSVCWAACGELVRTGTSCQMPTGAAPSEPFERREMLAGSSLGAGASTCSTA